MDKGLPANLKLPRLLVVMNDRIVKRFFRECIQRQGYKCLFAKDGAQALAVASKHLPEVIFYDFNMTDRQAFETLEILRTSRRMSAIRVLLFTQEVDAV
jgi:two-component system cell cycle response regulator DivK